MDSRFAINPFRRREFESRRAAGARLARRAVTIALRPGALARSMHLAPVAHNALQVIPFVASPRNEIGCMCISRVLAARTPLISRVLIFSSYFVNFEYHVRTLLVFDVTCCMLLTICWRVAKRQHVTNVDIRLGTN